MAYIIGITGGIGSGKTAATDWFAKQGITIIDADVIARQIVEPPSPILTQIQQQFGTWVCNADGSLNRTALREFIFKNPDARKQLEQITHPAIRAEIQQQLQHASSPYAILVSPLLFETKQHLLTQRTLLIDVDEQTQRMRASQRDATTPEQIQRIIDAQLPRTTKQQLADDIILNDGDLTQLYQKLAKLHQIYLNCGATA